MPAAIAGSTQALGEGRETLHGALEVAVTRARVDRAQAKRRPPAQGRRGQHGVAIRDERADERPVELVERLVVRPRPVQSEGHDAELGRRHQGEQGPEDTITTLKAGVNSYLNGGRPLYLEFEEQIKRQCDLVLDGCLTVDELASAIQTRILPPLGA